MVKFLLIIQILRNLRTFAQCSHTSRKHLLLSVPTEIFSRPTLPQGPSPPRPCLCLCLCLCPVSQTTSVFPPIQPQTREACLLGFSPPLSASQNSLLQQAEERILYHFEASGPCHTSTDPAKGCNYTCTSYRGRTTLGSSPRGRASTTFTLVQGSCSSL